MFSSNQILEVSGDANHIQIAEALNFALVVFGYEKKELCWQISKDNRYCIGWFSGNNPEDGWNKYPFDFDVNIVAAIICQFVEKTEKEEDMWDGSYYQGFLMQAIPESLSREYNGIKNPFYGIVSFKAFTTFYSK